MQAAYDQAVSQVNVATDTTGVGSAKATGITNINKAVTDAQTNAGSHNTPTYYPTMPDDNDQHSTLTMQSQMCVVTINPNVTNGYVHLYDQDGKQISNRVLGANTAWRTDYKRTINGQVFYRVGTNEYVKASDIAFGTGAKVQIIDGVVTIRSDVSNGTAPVYDSQGNRIASRNLAANTQWLTNNEQTLINGQVYYQVATNEYVASSDINWTPESIVLNNQEGVLSINQASAPVYHYDLDRSLMTKSQNKGINNKNAWFYDKQLIVNGHAYYRVATNEWVEDNKVLLG
ncbi:SLAP domain-containing protein [Bombilactobacillus folatiphilus]|uniref:SLAP domain-containing protein n=1 Tax=Bombilactobacillus folatiphilus TaxID=2923362 RepID=A0ABY4PAT6_9LACO|nr:SLAP domain-containing protein [Bombilactobacillus folatiphilus]UQS82735.1 SLAP domain-containing protein [Bombilactobacillus folatiphilus]